mgnify:CR=1 FL=1
MELLDFQVDAEQFLLDCCWRSRKRDIILKSPTGSGKTVILLKMIYDYLEEDRKTIFVWLTPGTVDLEEQSSQRMNELFPNIETQDVYDVIADGFNPKKVPFINWEMITKSGNTAIEKSDKKNLYDRIYEARLDEYQFILIIDEEHLYDTQNARLLIERFQPIHIVRASATARQNDLAEYMNIPIDRVINSGLITKYIIVNEGLKDNDDDNTYVGEAGQLIDLAIIKRSQIRDEYKEKELTLNPLIMIQLPNTSDDLLEEVEVYLDEKYAINFENGRLARRLTGRYKGNLNDIKRYDSSVDVLIFKEAGNVGWDCPRAKILVKLRTGMSENFEIQTIGRIRRMPFRTHYDNEILDNAFLYTYDIRFSQSVIEDLDNRAFHNITVSIKDDIQNIVLTKEYKSEDLIGFGERELYNTIYKYYSQKYDLTRNKAKNKEVLEYNHYSLSTQIETMFYHGEIVDISLEDLRSSDIVKRNIDVDLKIHSADLMHSIRTISEKIGLEYDRTKTILNKLFYKKDIYSKKVLDLSKKDYYSFIINNTEMIKKDMDEAISQETQQLTLKLPNANWSIPENDQVRVTSLDNPRKMEKNIMKEYPYVPSKSRSEKEFEKFVENSNYFKWIYKNGESFDRHFCIVYGNRAKQKLFFPDYILLDSNDKIWIIETKGGEDSNHKDKNIDKDVYNKFNSLKNYAIKNKINFGFVRDSEVTDLLYISNTEYVDDLTNEVWIKLDDVF